MGVENRKDLIALPILLWLHFLSYTFPKKRRRVLTLYEDARKIQKFHKLVKAVSWGGKTSQPSTTKACSTAP